MTSEVGYWAWYGKQLHQDVFLRIKFQGFKRQSNVKMSETSETRTILFSNIFLMITNKSNYNKLFLKSKCQGLKQQSNGKISKK